MSRSLRNVLTNQEVFKSRNRSKQRWRWERFYPDRAKSAPLSQTKPARRFEPAACHSEPTEWRGAPPTSVDPRRSPRMARRSLDPTRRRRLARQSVPHRRDGARPVCRRAPPVRLASAGASPHPLSPPPLTGAGGRRSVAGDVAEDVSLLSCFQHPKTGRRSRCYRISYRSMERTLTNEEVTSPLRESRPPHPVTSSSHVLESRPRVTSSSHVPVQSSSHVPHVTAPVTARRGTAHPHPPTPSTRVCPGTAAP